VLVRSDVRAFAEDLVRRGLNCVERRGSGSVFILTFFPLFPGEQYIEEERSAHGVALACDYCLTIEAEPEAGFRNMRTRRIHGLFVNICSFSFAQLSFLELLHLSGACEKARLAAKGGG